MNTGHESLLFGRQSMIMMVMVLPRRVMAVVIIMVMVASYRNLSLGINNTSATSVRSGNDDVLRVRVGR